MFRGPVRSGVSGWPSGGLWLSAGVSGGVGAVMPRQIMKITENNMYFILASWAATENCR